MGKPGPPGEGFSETDKYGRLLRYVYAGDVMVNAVLVRERYAQAVTYPPGMKYTDICRGLQREARGQGHGLWISVPVKSDVNAENDCDPAYPTVFIPSPPPDLDCPDVPHWRFNVLLPDPQRFDGDEDGIGCER